MDRAPHLSFTGHGAQPEAVVLLLHGGTPDSLAPVRGFDPSVVRMIPIGRSVFRAGRGRIALAKLRYAVRGWNGEVESPLADARWALDQIAERFGHLPIGLVGHSMGGRVALRVNDHGVEGQGPQGTQGSQGTQGTQGANHGWGVRSLAALAPWLPDGEPIPALGDRVLLLAHGTADRITDPAKTTELAEKLSADGGDVELLNYPGGRHSMLFPSKPWHDLVAGFMVRTLLAPPPENQADPLRR
jgi:hypothetical protein